MYRPNVIASYCACSVWKPINKTIPREEQKKTPKHYRFE